MSLRLLAVACNYPGEDYALPDCESDAQSMEELFAPYASSATVLLSRKATRTKIISAVQDFLETLCSGDLGLLSFSGHGTRERKGNKWVEAIVANDGQLIYEDELRTLLNDRASGVILAMLSDSCNSGGLPRGNGRQVRTVPVRLLDPHEFKPPKRSPPRPNAVYTACKDTEYAYSTGQGGAMSLATRASFEEAGSRTTLQSLHKKIRARLPSPEYGQSPQFFCRDKKLAARTIKSFQAK